MSKAKFERLGIQHRSGEITLKRAAEGDEQATYEIAISSDNPIKRWWGIEILSHDRGAVDLSRFKRGAPLLLQHEGNPVGVILPETVRIDDDKVLRAEVKFSRNARGQEVEQDVKDGIWRFVSVGYFVDRVKREDDGSDENKPATYRATRWQPAEASLVGIPADLSVGVGRKEDGDQRAVEFEVDERATEEERQMQIRSIPLLDANGGGGGAAAPTVEAGASNERKRADEIRAMCRTNLITEDVAERFILDGLSAAQVSERVVAAVETRAKPVGSLKHLTGRDAEAVADYSYHRAIRNALAEKEGTGKFDGLEAEVSEELARSYPLARKGGFLVPLSTRTTLDTLTPTKGAELVETSRGELIEVLRKRARVIQSGARVLSGLTGPVAFPKQTGVANVLWVGENPGSDVADTEPSFALVTSQPKYLMGNIPFTRQLLSQASIDVEAMTREELGIGHGLAIDLACLHGLGANGEPLGVYGQAGVASHDASSSWTNGFTYPLLSTAMLGAIAAANADTSTMRWITTPQVGAKAKATLAFSAAGSETIWTGTLENGAMLGYGASTTSQGSVTMTGSARTGGSAHCLVFGNWADLYVLMYGAMELVVDPYSRKKRAIIEVTSWQGADTVFRHGESFAKAINLTLTG